MESRRHPARTLALSLILFPLLAFAGPETAKEPPPDLDKQVKNLGDPDFKIREAASEALAKAGESARETLKQAARSEDLEVSTRAKAILDALDHPLPPPVPLNEQAAIKCMKILLDAEANFFKADYDNNGKDFAFDLAALHDLKDVHGNAIGLIHESFAHGKRAGYRFGTMATSDAKKNKDRKFGFAYHAVPETYEKDGTRTFIVSQRGADLLQEHEGGAAHGLAGGSRQGRVKEGWDPLKE